jgi:hypothetical protein
MAAAIWTAYSTKQLTDFAEQQAKDMSSSLEMTRNAIFAANKQAVAMEATNDIMKSTANKQLRAYITQHAISANDSMTSNMSSTFYYKNVGQTPALAVRVRAAVEIVSPSGLDVNPPRESATSFDESAPMQILGSGVDTQDYINKLTPLFKESEIKELRTGSKVYVVWGAIYYRDIFDQFHYTKFCKYFSKGEFSRWNLCSTYNDSD